MILLRHFLPPPDSARASERRPRASPRTTGGADGHLLLLLLLLLIQTTGLAAAPVRASDGGVTAGSGGATTIRPKMIATPIAAPASAPLESGSSSDDVEGQSGFGGEYDSVGGPGGGGGGTTASGGEERRFLSTRTAVYLGPCRASSYPSEGEGGQRPFFEFPVSGGIGRGVIGISDVDLVHDIALVAVASDGGDGLDEEDDGLGEYRPSAVAGEGGGGGGRDHRGIIEILPPDGGPSAGEYGNDAFGLDPDATSYASTAPTYAVPFYFSGVPPDGGIARVRCAAEVERMYVAVKEDGGGGDSGGSEDDVVEATVEVGSDGRKRIELRGAARERSAGELRGEGGGARSAARCGGVNSICPDNRDASTPMASFADATDTGITVGIITPPVAPAAAAVTSEASPLYRPLRGRTGGGSDDEDVISWSSGGSVDDGITNDAVSRRPGTPDGNRALKGSRGDGNGQCRDK